MFVLLSRGHCLCFLDIYFQSKTSATLVYFICYCLQVIFTLRDSIVIGPVCVFAVGGRAACLWVCYDDNSKLRASILTKLGL